MKHFVLSIATVGALGLTPAFAVAPGGAPSGSTGICKDGTYSSSAEKKGACRGHKGVQEWYGEEPATKSAATPATSERAARPSSSTPAASSSEKTASPAMAGRTSGAPISPAPAVGGQVWANESTKVYHCSGDKWYGKTKHGEYMSENDAKAKGFHADHGKSCG